MLKLNRKQLLMLILPMVVAAHAGLFACGSGNNNTPPPPAVAQPYVNPTVGNPYVAGPMPYNGAYGTQFGWQPWGNGAAYSYMFQAYIGGAWQNYFAVSCTSFYGCQVVPLYNGLMGMGMNPYFFYQGSSFYLSWPSLAWSAASAYQYRMAPFAGPYYGGWNGAYAGAWAYINF